MAKRLLLLALCIGLGGIPVFAEEAVTLDMAMQRSVEYIAGRVVSGSKVVVLNFKTEHTRLADYIIDELTAYIVNDGRLKAVDRQNLELIRAEMDFQLSGEVSDESAQSIGRKLGAQTIISGEIVSMGDTYRLRIRAISVETAEIEGMQNISILADATIAVLTDTQTTRPKAVKTPRTPRTSTAGAGGISRLYLGARLGGSVGFYEDTRGWTDDGYENGGSFDFAVQAAIQFTNALAIQAELMYTSDRVTGEKTEYYSSPLGSGTRYSSEINKSSSLLIPLLAKATLRPGIFSISALAGVYFTIPLGQMGRTGKSSSGDYQYESDFNVDPPLGFMAGGVFGVKAGPGNVFADIRYAADFGNTMEDGDYDLYKRSKLFFTLGYEIGLIRKK